MTFKKENSIAAI